MALLSTPSTRAPTQQRSVRTRERILEATVACLIERGYAATTTSAVQDAAGVSRGALMHHFSSKQELLLEATAHLVAERGAWLYAQAESLPDGSDRTRRAIALLLEAFRGRLFDATIELWVAARTDPDLRSLLREHERWLAREAQGLMELLFTPPVARHPRFRDALDLVQLLFRGAALTRVLRDDPAWEDALVDRATEVFATHLERPHPGDEETVTT